MDAVQGYEALKKLPQFTETEVTMLPPVGEGFIEYKERVLVNNLNGAFVFHLVQKRTHGMFEKATFDPDGKTLTVSWQIGAFDTKSHAAAYSGEQISKFVEIMTAQAKSVGLL